MTPPARGILAGITRGHVLRIARELGLVTQDRELTLEAFRAAEEAFLTSTYREIAPLTRLDGELAFGGAPGPITRRLHARFREKARAVLPCASKGSSTPGEGTSPPTRSC